MQKETKDSSRAIPLNCVDKCLLALDGIGEPVTTYAILDLQGEVDPARLNQAIQSAQQVHPRMRTVLRSRFFRLVREVKENLREGVVAVHDPADSGVTTYEECLFRFLNQRIDTRKEFPFRVALIPKRNDCCSLVFTFHHSVVDGLRALIFVRTIIDFYNNGNFQECQPQEDPRMYSSRDELLEFAQSQRARIEKYSWKMFFYLFRRFIVEAFAPPTRVYHDRSGKSKDIDHFAIELKANELEHVLYNAATAHVELNDIVLAALYKTVEKWNSLHGKTSKKIRIMAPVNLSPKGFKNIVSNQASWLSLSTMPEDRTNPAELLRKVRAYTISEMQNRAAFSLIYFFYFCSRFPLFVVRGMCRFLIVTRTYVDSILITNLGTTWPKAGSDESSVTIIGSAKIVNITGSTAVVTPMGMSLCMGIYNRNLSVTAAYRTALFSRAKVEAFLNLYLQQIKDYEVTSNAVKDSIIKT